LLSSPALGTGSAGLGEFERLKASYNMALLEQQRQEQEQGRPRSGSTGAGNLDYLFRASELDSTVVQKGAGLPLGVYEVSGDGRPQVGDGRSWAGSPGLLQQ